MNINDLHLSVGHANDTTLRRTAKQFHTKRTVHRQHCGDCSDVKAIRAAALKTTSIRAARPLERLSGDLTMPFAPSAGGARCFMCRWGGRLLQRGLGAISEEQDRQHRRLRSSSLLCRNQAAVHGSRAGEKSPQGHHRLDSSWRKILKDMLAELDIKRELTPLDGARRNGRVKRKLA